MWQLIFFDEAVKPGYRLSIAQIFTAATKICTFDPVGRRLFCGADGIAGIPRGARDLPSWVPDYWRSAVRAAPTTVSARRSW